MVAHRIDSEDPGTRLSASDGAATRFGAIVPSADGRTRRGGGYITFFASRLLQEAQVGF